MKTSTTIPFAATVLLMAATLAGAWVTDQRSTVTPLARPLDQIPATLAGWSMTADEPLEATVLEQLKPTTYISRIYGNGARRLGLLIVYYAQQRAGESMHSPEHCLPGGGWQIRRREIESLPLAGRTVHVNRYAIAHAGENDVMYYWYQSQRRVIAAESLGKALLAWDALARGRTEGSLVRIVLPDTGEEARPGRAFAVALLEEMQRVVPDRGQRVQVAGVRQLVEVDDARRAGGDHLPDEAAADEAGAAGDQDRSHASKAPSPRGPHHPAAAPERPALP